MVHFTESVVTDETRMSDVLRNNPEGAQSQIGKSFKGTGWCNDPKLLLDEVNKLFLNKILVQVS